jgi:hypothetical protein
MSTPKIPCQAKNPERCRYHGAILRSERALRAGNMDGYLTAQTEVTEAAKDSKEVREFFARTGNLKLDNHGNVVPDVSRKNVLGIVTNMYKGHRIPDRAETVDKVMAVMQEPNEGMHPWHDKYPRVQQIISDGYDEIDNNDVKSRIATDRVYLANGLIVTTTFDGSKRIMDERSTIESTVPAEQVKVGDVIRLGNARYEVTEIDYENEVDGFIDFALENGLVDRKPHLNQPFVYTAGTNQDFKILQ